MEGLFQSSHPLEQMHVLSCLWSPASVLKCFLNQGTVMMGGGGGGGGQLYGGVYWPHKPLLEFHCNVCMQPNVLLVGVC